MISPRDAWTQNGYRCRVLEFEFILWGLSAAETVSLQLFSGRILLYNTPGPSLMLYDLAGYN